MERHEIRWLEVEGHVFAVIERVVSQTGQRWFVGSRTPLAIALQQKGKQIMLGMDGEPLEVEGIEAELQAGWQAHGAARRRS